MAARLDRRAETPGCGETGKGLVTVFGRASYNSDNDRVEFTRRTAKKWRGKPASLQHRRQELTDSETVK